LKIYPETSNWRWCKQKEVAMSSESLLINLSLVSHTNVGKTTLARTLLKKDIGEIGDRPHVTALPESHLLIADGNGSSLTLWDTPGFGDSVRLVKRLSLRKNPIGWFLSEVWDRWMSRPLWSSQQAMNNVREQSDVVLYLVNASESPSAAAYVEAEMQILSWVEKPVLVLLNQMGKPLPKEAEEKDQAAWRHYFDRFPFVSGVLPMDAFARCWIQEIALFEAIGKAMPNPKKAAFEVLQAAWATERIDVYRLSVAAIGKFLAALAADTEHFESDGLTDKFKSIGRKFGWANEKDLPPAAMAMEHLAERAAVAMKSLTDQLIELNGLKGEAAKEILTRVNQDLSIDEEISEGGAAVVGAVLSGAISGFAADLMTGGLTLGAGAIAGAVLGGLAFAGVAKGYNQLAGKDGTIVRWNQNSIYRFFIDTLLLYLAVAHFGRGRGEWSKSEYPEHWRTEVQRAVEGGSTDLPSVAEGGAPNDRGRLEEEFSRYADWAIEKVLGNLYPETKLSKMITNPKSNQ
jgi:GTP-binding protein EngB required for normal cell division